MLSITSTQFSIQQEPDGLRELKHRVYFAKDINGYLEEWQGELTFYGQDYAYLRKQFIEGACSVIPVIISDGCVRSYKANLFLNTATWRPDICQVTVEVIDAGYLTLIANNKDIKAYLNVPRSKNDVDISAYTNVQTDCEFKEYETGVDSPTSANREGIRLYDAFKFLIAFMSDGEMDFESDYFATESDPALPTINRNPTLFDFEEITSGGGSAYPYISFEELITDAYKLYNFEFGVEFQNNGRPLFRIETPSYFQGASTSISMDDVSAISQFAEQESYYQKLIIGSSDVQTDHDYYDPIQLFSWDKEEYHLGGNCNSEAILDLRLQTLVSDTNLIQDALPSATGGTDSEASWGKVAIVVMDGNNITIVSDNPINPAYQNFNGRLKNDEVLNRFYGAIPNSIYLFLGENQNDAQSNITTTINPNLSTPTITNPVESSLGMYADFVEFPVEINDPNNNMGTDTTGFQFGTFGTITNSQCTSYTAPVSGVYDITVKLVQNVSDFATQVGCFYLATYPSASTTYDQVVPFGDNFGNPIDWYPVLQNAGYSEQGDIYTENGFSVCEGSITMFLNSGDRLVVICTFDNTNSPTTGYQPTSIFSVTDNLSIERTFDPQSNYLINSVFEYPVTPDGWNNFLNDRHGKITVTHQNGIVYGYLREATRNLEDGITEWKIRSNFGNA